MEGDKKQETVYVDTFMTEEEENRQEFDSEQALSSFIIK